jgi:glycosyltransferase involved in cell wall biosynthesis
MFVRAPHRVVAVGEAQRSAIARAYRLEPSRMTVIRNGVDDARARAVSTEAERIRRGAPLVIGSLSTLIEQKGLDQLLQAARLLVQRGTAFRLVIVGDGHLRQPMETLARDLGLATHVEFLGWMEDAARRVLPHIDIFVQSSLWEAMSIVVLEAMSCARPIVATTVGDNPFVLRDGESGFLVPPRSPQALADRMSQLAGDPALRARLGAEARGDYEQRYTAARMCDDYARLYRDLAGKRHGTRFWRGTSTPPPAIGDGR